MQAFYKEMLTVWLVQLDIPSVLALDNGLAVTPPMGWMTWLAFECTVDCEQKPRQCISEDLIKRTANRMVSDGYLSAGYEYVVIDDCWLEQERGPGGRLVPDRQRFKGGMKALSDYVHSKKLKFGMYEDYGTKTCAGYPGLLESEQLDVDTFASWDIDYLKVDGCYADTATFEEGYPALGKMLNASGRSILYSCSWPAYQEGNMKPNYTAIAKSCNIWRNYGDISNSWGSVVGIMDWFGDNQDRLIPHAGPGHWNDPDMLVVGNNGLSVDQARAQMAVWSILAAPLIMSVDLDEIKPEFKEILLNGDVIAVNQDALGKQGRRISKSSVLDVWMRELSGHHYALAVVWKTGNATYTSLTLNQMQIPNARYDVQELFKAEGPRILEPDATFTVTTDNAPGVKFYKFAPKKKEEDLKVECNVDIEVNNEINVR